MLSKIIFKAHKAAVTSVFSVNVKLFIKLAQKLNKAGHENLAGFVMSSMEMGEQGDKAWRQSQTYSELAEKLFSNAQLIENQKQLDVATLCLAHAVKNGARKVKFFSTEVENAMTQAIKQLEQV